VDLEAQISLMTVPQEFSRLCNAVLAADHSDDFLPIDDDRPDRGNDGYLKSEKRMFAAHCFKRAQNRSLDNDIRGKMLGDLGKAITLKREGLWEVESWTFLTNYPIPDAIAERVVEVGNEAGIGVSWRGADFLAERVRRHDLRQSFPDLHVTQIDTRLAEIEQSLEAMSPESLKPAAKHSYDLAEVPLSRGHQAALIHERAPGWEYLLYAGVLLQGRNALEVKWHDEELGMARGEPLTLEPGAEFEYLSNEFSRLRVLVGSVQRVFEPAAQEQASGAPGEAGDPIRIENLARHVIGIYEGLLDWAARLRAVVPPDHLERTFELTALMAKAPIVQFRQFVDELVRELGKLPAHLASESEETLQIQVDLVLRIDPEVLAEFEAEMDRLRRIL
jgi:hypothetical protein